MAGSVIAIVFVQVAGVTGEIPRVAVRVHVGAREKTENHATVVMTKSV